MAEAQTSPPRVVINLAPSEKKRWENFAYKDGFDSPAGWVKRIVRLHVRRLEEPKIEVRPPDPRW